MIRGIIFDMDGVLLDNVEFHLRAFKQLGKEQGKQLTEEDILAVFGQRNSEMLPSLLGKSLSREEIQALADRKEKIYRNLIRPHLQEAAVDGLVSFVQEAASRFSLAVATSGPADNVSMVLQGLGIESHFQVVVTAADVSKGKPDPEIFLIAAHRLRLPPEQCLVFEDSESGVQAAKNAGCFCIALSTTLERSELKELSPDTIIKDFSQVGVEEIRRL